MNKKLLFFSLLSISLMFSCSDEEKDETTEDVTDTTVVTTGFVYNENGGASITADSAYYQEQYKTIKAFKAGEFIEINLTAGTAATYTIGSSNAVSMLKGTALYSATSGSVVITSNASSKMTGTFTTSGSGASLTQLSGKFTEISVR